MRISWLGWLEGLALCVWLALAAHLIGNNGDNRVVLSIDPDALVLGPSQERWMGIFFEDQHVGFSVARSATVDGGGTLYEGRSQFRVATFGKIQQITTAGTALVDSSGALTRFDFVMLADQVRLVARGEVKGKEVVMEIDQAGATSVVRFPVTKPPHVGMSLESVIRSEELSVGHSFSVPYFDPLTLAEGEMEIEVVDVEVFDGGEEAYWLVSRFGDIETRSLVTPSGETLRQEGAIGMSMVRMTAEEAQKISDEAPQDLISLSAVPFKGKLKNARQTRYLKVEVLGVSADRMTHQPPQQVVFENTVTVDMPLALEIPSLPLLKREELTQEDVQSPDRSPYLRATPTLPVGHLDIQNQAWEIVENATDRFDAIKRINDWVFTTVKKEPSVGVPNGLEVLYSKRGDCNEHTALFVSLARAAQIPTRIAAGVVYSDRVGPKGQFYYHAWPEVQLGGENEWIPVDPTFGQLPADATHIKLVEGDLNRQVEILGVIGRLELQLIEAR
jgi:hypothetical protein